jgi:putative transcriptional regulator
MNTKTCDFMAIKWRLSAVMADREIDNQTLHLLTGLHPGTISKLRNNPPSRIDVITLNLLCQALNCQPGELLRFQPDSPQENSSNQAQNQFFELQASINPHINRQNKIQSAA